MISHWVSALSGGLRRAALPAARLTVLTISALCLLPILAFGAVYLAFDATRARHAIEEEAMSRAETLMNIVDIGLSRSTASLAVLATSHYFRSGNWDAAGMRADEVRQLNPDWQSISLVDLKTGALLFSTGGNPAPFADMPEIRSLAKTPARVAIGGMARRPGRCTCVLMVANLSGPRTAGKVLVVEISPDAIQRAIADYAHADNVTAIVDKDGRFIGRSINFHERVGYPATHYVRDAVRRGGRGLYKAETYEGLKNYTAYVKSTETGWSTHIAISSSHIIIPTGFSWLAFGFAALITCVFMGAMVWFGVRVLRGQRDAEHRLQAAERMDALGKLTGGIAHDFNNMLAIIGGNLELASRGLDRGRDIRPFLAHAQGGVSRAADLTQRMLAFSRDQSLTATVEAPEAIVRAVADMLDRTLGSHIRLDIKVASDAWAIQVDRTQLENALVNLAANSRDALTDGGVITFEVYNMPAGSLVLGHKLAVDHVVLAVSDNGQGMPEAVRKRALEPFFTTKPTGRGTGLGLSQVYGFAKHSGGDLFIDSTPGKGTRVVMILPRGAVGDAVATTGDAATASRTSAPPDLDIVLVEDDDALRRTTGAALIDMGHRVRSASGGQAALDLVASARPDIVITDVIMPDMNGWQLAQHLAEVAPGLPVLFLTGYGTEDATVGADHVVRKPCDMATLDQAIARCLSG